MNPCWTVVFLLTCVHESLQWSGWPWRWWYHYNSCCCGYSNRREAVTSTRYRCDSMWTHDGDQNCDIPVCSPSCGTGKCIVKNYNVHGCDCPDGRTGADCSENECSYKDPCYPGECQGTGSIWCYCQQGFDGVRCLELPTDWKASITNIHARMSFWNRRIRDAPKNEEYGLEIYSTEESTTKWTNMEKFNWLNVTATAMFSTETPPRPSYVSNSGFGIVDAKINIKLLKVPVQGALGGHLREEEVPCSETIAVESPVFIANCVVNKPNFDYLLENGDRLTLEFAVATGGFRKLMNRKNGSDMGIQTYKQNKVTTTVVYRFDFEKPRYKGSKSDAFHTNGDFTKDPISLKWLGWVDDQSGMGRYTWEAFRLEPNGDGDLREADKMRPEIHRQLDHSEPLSYPLPYKPKKAGMYSFVLEAVDKANNSVYMRRCVLYDPESSVTTDTKHGLFISSSHRDSSGHQWINDSSTPLVATWTNHFLNYAHEKGKYLNRVLELSVRLVPDEDIYKRVDKANDDYEGDRTVNAVPNVRGIVKFQTAHAISKTGAKMTETPLDWKDETNFTTFVTFREASATSGSTLTFWVRAFDVVDNRKVDSTTATFDFSKPTLGNLELQRNKPSRIPFGSKLVVPSMDQESGIEHVELKVKQMQDGRLLTNKTFAVQSMEPADCTDKVRDCYCPPSLTVCYKRINELYISNCWLMVSKTSLETAEVRIDVGVVNRAGLMTSASMTITDLMSLNGTEAYFGPMDVKTDKISQSGVRVTWHHAPSCYPRTFIWLSYDDSGNMIKIHKDAESYDLTDLDPGRKYTVMVRTDYGGIKSKPVEITFNTLDAPGIGAGTVAGIVIGLCHLSIKLILDRIPVKWTAPECLKSMKEANEKSDIWSYGVTLWEIFSMGQTPYPNVRSRDLPVKIQNGHRLSRPEYAEDIHYEFMKSCWYGKPEQRPTFTMAVDKLEKSFGLRPTSGVLYYYSK